MRVSEQKQGFVFEFAYKVGLLGYIAAFLGIEDDLKDKIENLFRDSKKLIHSLEDDTLRGVAVSFLAYSVYEYETLFKQIGNKGLKSLYWQSYADAEIKSLFRKEVHRLFDSVNERSYALIESTWPEKDFGKIVSLAGKGEVYHTDLLMVFDDDSMLVADYGSNLTFSKSPLEIIDGIHFSVLDRNTLDYLNLDYAGDALDVVSSNLINTKRVLEYVGHNREIGKLLQAASYAHSFLKAFPDYGIETVYLKAFTGSSSRFFRVDRKKLKQIGSIYKLLKKRKWDALDQLTAIFEDKLPTETVRSAYEAYVHEKKGSETKTFSLCLTDDDFTPLGNDLRIKHGSEVKVLLRQGENLVLLGNPGIGKTHSVVEWLSERGLSEEPLLIIYSSPRIAVNSDFVEKVSGMVRNREFVTLTSNSTLGNITLYRASETAGNALKARSKELEAVNCYPHKGFGKSHRQEYGNEEQRGRLINVPSTVGTGKKHYKTVEIKEKDKDSTGILMRVLQSAERIDEILDSQNIKERTDIVFSLTIQALRTLLNSVDRSGDLAQKFYELMQTRKVLFFIDEITGTPEGVVFIGELLKKLRMENCKWIIADASLSSGEVFSYLFSKAAEGDKLSIPRILISEKPVSGGLSKERRNIAGLDFTVVNLNSYPAKSLRIEAWLYTGSASHQNDFLLKLLLEEAEKGNKPILYLQDKDRIDKLERRLRKSNRRLKILQVKSDLSHDEKEKVARKVQNPSNYDIVLITSSSSRGLSYKYSKTVILDAQRFDLESGLMEAMQAVYRARGLPNDDKVSKKVILTYRDPVTRQNDRDTPYKRQIGAFNYLLFLYLTLQSIYSRMGARQARGAVIPIGKIEMEKGKETDDTTIMLQVLNWASSRREYTMLAAGESAEDEEVIKAIKWVYDSRAFLTKLTVRPFGGSSALAELMRYVRAFVSPKDTVVPMRKWGKKFRDSNRGFVVVNGFLLPVTPLSKLLLEMDRQKVERFLFLLKRGYCSGERVTFNSVDKRQCEHVHHLWWKIYDQVRKEAKDGSFERSEVAIFESNKKHKVALFLPLLFLENIDMAGDWCGMHRSLVRFSRLAGESVGLGSVGFTALHYGLSVEETAKTGLIRKRTVKVKVASRRGVREDVAIDFLAFIFDPHSDAKVLYDRNLRNDFFEKSLFAGII